MRPYTAYVAAGNAAVAAADKRRHKNYCSVYAASDPEIGVKGHSLQGVKWSRCIVLVDVLYSKLQLPQTNPPAQRAASRRVGG